MAKTLPFEFSTLDPNLLAGREPLSSDDVELLIAAGVTHVLDLREEREVPPESPRARAIEQMTSAGIVRKSVPMREMGSPTQEALSDAVDWLNTTLDNPQARVYVHCRAGLERTGAVLTARESIGASMPYSEALLRLQIARPGLIPRDPQANAVKAWIYARSQTHALPGP